jgi:pyruvate,water dikinase
MSFTPEKEKIIFTKDWVFLVGRPYTLFGASLYQAWFDSSQIIKLFGMSISDNLYVEEHPNIVRRYVTKKQLDAFTAAIKKIVIHKRKNAKAILKKGLHLSEKAKKYIENPPFNNLEKAIKFLVELALHATVFSYFSYPIAKKANDLEIIKLAEKLRAVSYYPQVVSKIINPLAEHTAGRKYNFMTIEEILKKKTIDVAAREKLCKSGKRFVFAKIDGKEIIYYVNDVVKLIEKLEKIRIGEYIKGQIAYPGKVSGKVRLVLTNDINIKFNRGDILVAATTNPTLTPLIKKSSAIVTDEGGITSHAAILSRELKKPCIIGTKFATHTFRDGDKVEVDANNGIVKSLK